MTMRVILKGNPKYQKGKTLQVQQTDYPGGDQSSKPKGGGELSKNQQPERFSPSIEPKSK